MLAAVTQNGDAIEYASEELKVDVEILLTAVTQNRLVLKSLPDDVIKIIEFMEESIKKNPNAVDHLKSQISTYIELAKNILTKYTEIELNEIELAAKLMNAFNNAEPTHVGYKVLFSVSVIVAVIAVVSASALVVNNAKFELVKNLLTKFKIPVNDSTKTVINSVLSGTTAIAGVGTVLLTVFEVKGKPNHNKLENNLDNIINNIHDKGMNKLSLATKELIKKEVKTGQAAKFSK